MNWKLALLFSVAGAAFAQADADRLPPALEDVGFDQKLGAQIPLDLPFRDDAGRDIRLRDYFGKKPVVLALVYYECPMLCTQALNGLLRAVRAVPFDAGEAYDIVAVSINPRETPELAASKKASYVERYGRAGRAGGWHFLTGPQESIDKLAGAVGFRYRRLPESGQYAHAAGITVATPGGKLARYLYGVEYSARDLRLSLVEASEEKIGSPVDQFLLYCFHYDPATGKYGVLIQNVIRIVGTSFAIGLAVFLILLLRRERRDAPVEAAGRT